jgi:hypothetical protein
MDEIIRTHKGEFNKECYFFGVLSPKNGKLKFWRDIYYDYIQRKEYPTFDEWVRDMNYKVEEIYYGSTKLKLEENIKLTDLIKDYSSIYEFTDEEEDVHQDEEMQELSSAIGSWCLCCKRTCSMCSKKNN